MAWYDPFKAVGSIVNKTADYLAGTSAGQTVNKALESSSG